MEQALQKTLADGIQLTIVPTNKFKTSIMRFALILPLGGEKASAFAALAPVLRRGTAQHPDMQSIGAALDTLYGARVEPFTRKVGDNLAIGFISDVVDETYIAGSNGLTAQAVAMLCAFVNDPLLQDGVFAPEYVESEKENLAIRIEAMKNDPRSYAQRRVIEVMCKDEVFGQSEYGTAEGARALQAQTLFAAYQDALQNARIELFYCGAMQPMAVEEAFCKALAVLPQKKRYQPQTVVKKQPDHTVQTVVEEMNVRQGKLSIGLRTGITGADDLYPAMMLFDNAYGGSTNSKLFLNVREHMSLCYYASSSINKHNGIMVVSSGIENKNFEIARDEILRQLHEMQKGGITSEEIESARRTVLSMLRTMADSPISLERFWLGQAVSGWHWDLEQLSRSIAAVSQEAVAKAAQSVQTDTIYFLKGVGE